MQQCQCKPQQGLLCQHVQYKAQSNPGQRSAEALGKCASVVQPNAERVAEKPEPRKSVFCRNVWVLKSFESSFFRATWKSGLEMDSYSVLDSCPSQVVVPGPLHAKGSIVRFRSVAAMLWPGCFFCVPRAAVAAELPSSCRYLVEGSRRWRRRRVPFCRRPASVFLTTTVYGFSSC